MSSMNPNLLPADVWLQVFLHLEYFDLNRIRRLKKFFYQSSSVRSAQEALFLAPFDADSLEMNHQEGDEIQVHPAILQATFKSTKSHPRYWEDIYLCHDEPGQFGIGDEPFKEGREENLGKQNATNPPVHRVDLLDYNWPSDGMRNGKWNTALYRPTENQESYLWINTEEERSAPILSDDEAPSPLSSPYSSSSSDFSSLVKEVEEELNHVKEGGVGVAKDATKDYLR